MGIQSDTTDRTLFGTGANDIGQLGLGSDNTSAQSTIVQSLAGIDFQDVSAGYRHTLVVKNGELWSFGYNSRGLLGQGGSDTIAHPNPAQVTSPAVTWANVEAGYATSFAIASNGDVYGWGYGEQVGDGESTDKYAPVRVCTAYSASCDSYLTSVDSLSAGYNYTLAINGSGEMFSWGFGGSGCLGQSDYASTLLAAQMNSDTDWESVSAGDGTAYAIKTDGTLWTWGSNSYGARGDGEAFHLMPMPVALP
jgi:alpha-tubulin suppressor-like RCC1 family protein